MIAFFVCLSLGLTSWFARWPPQLCRPEPNDLLGLSFNEPEVATRCRISWPPVAGSRGLRLATAEFYEFAIDVLLKEGKCRMTILLLFFVVRNAIHVRGRGKAASETRVECCMSAKFKVALA